VDDEQEMIMKVLLMH